MKKQQLLLSAAALALGFSAIPALAASSNDDTKSGAGSSTAKQLECKGLKGTALDTCLQQQKNTARPPGRSEDAAARKGSRTPGHSEDAASRKGGSTPGRSEVSASRTGEPPGKIDSSPKGAPAASGTSKGNARDTKK
jgi:hypothetical protein